MNPQRMFCRALVLGVVILPGLALVACAGKNGYVAPPVKVPSDGSESIDRARQLAAEAQRAETGGKPKEAIELYKKSIESYRDFPAAWHNLGLVQLQDGQTLAAVESFKTAGDLDSKDPRPPFNIGVIYESQGWAAEAQKYYTESLARDENYLEALRRSVYLDLTENHFTQTTLERIRRALASERDPQWRAFFERSQLRIDQFLHPQQSDASGPVNVPSANPQRHR